MAQERIVTGTVVDEYQRGIAGVNVMVKGTAVGTAADAEGKFSIEVSGQDPVLVFSFIGYTTREVVVGNLSVVQVSLDPFAEILSELVVVGYGVQQKKDVTGSIAVADGKELSAIPAGNIENNLQGRLAGVNVISSGDPGGVPLVVIRGASSFAGSSRPLYVVDGVPTFDISTINPSDIESVTALKDAGAASIYGSRAANGVIVITTKKGESGTMKLSYQGYYGLQSPGKGITNYLDPQGFADLTWLAYQNSGETPPDGMYGNGATPVVPDYFRPAGKFERQVDESTYNETDNPITRTNKFGTNWYDEMTEVAPIQNHDLSVSGASDNARYFVGLNYFNQDGIVMYTGAKRYSMRINTEFTIKDKIRIGENLTNVYQSISVISSGSRGVNTMLDCYLTPVILPVYDIAGNFSISRNPSERNPYASQYFSKNRESYGIRTFGNVYGEIDFLKSFTFRTAFGGSFRYARSYVFMPRIGTASNSFEENSNDEADWNWQNTLTFHKKINAHSFNVLAGIEMIKSDIGRSISGRRIDYLYEDPEYWSLNNGNVKGQTNSGSNKTPSSLLSFFSRMDYNFRDRYLLSLTIRRDGSSKFINHRYGTFPSATIAWRLSEETFLQGSGFLSDLKLRAGYGVMGDQINASANNSYTAFISDPGGTYYDIDGNNFATQFGIGQGFIGNPNGQWQENKTLNLGIDFSLFNSHLDGSIDVYKKETDKLLYTSELPGTNGTALPPAVNVGKMENKGIDLALSYRANIKKKWKFESTLTFTSYTNKVIKIANNVPSFMINDVIRIQPGQPVSAFYGFQVEGLWQSEEEIQQADKLDGNTSTPFQKDASPGRFRYRDVDGDGSIDADHDRTFIGNPNADFTTGLNLSLSFGNFDVTAFLFAVYGNDIFNYSKHFTQLFATSDGAKSLDLLYKSWTPQRKNATIPVAETSLNFGNATMNSFYVEDGSYLRLKNIQIGYSFQRETLRKAGIRKMRMYVQAVNLFTLKNTTLPEPELGGSAVGFGVGGMVYPTSQQFIGGFNLEF